MMAQQTVHMLTTVDNPFNPFTEYNEWRAWDARAGYFTPEFLARIVKSSNELSEADQQSAIEAAILEIIEENVSGVYRSVTAESAAEFVA